MAAAAAATVDLVYDDTASDVNHRETFEAIVYPLGEALDPDAVIAVDHDPRDFLQAPTGEPGFRLPDVDLSSKGLWSGLQRDLVSHLVANRSVTIFRNAELKLYSRVGETEDDFLSRCRSAAEDAADAAVAKLRDRFGSRIDSLQDQIRTAASRLDEARSDAAGRQQEEVISGAGDLLGTFLGGRSRSNPLGRVASRRAATQRAQARVDAASGKLEGKEQDLEDLETELAEAIEGIVAEHQGMAETIEEVSIPLEKTDVRIVDMKLVWLPVA
jgi:hypothetical protein